MTPEAMRLCVPAYFPPEGDDFDHVAEIARVNEASRPRGGITEVYGSFGFLAHPGGRRRYVLPSATPEKAARYVEGLRALGVEFHYVFNMLHAGNREYRRQQREALLSTIDTVHREYGVRSFIASNRNIIELILDRVPDAFVTVSAVADVDEVEGFLDFAELGVRRIVLSKKKIRDFALMKQIADHTDVEIEIMVNQLCHISRPWCHDHYAFLCDSSCGEQEEPDIFYSRCELERLEDPVSLIKSVWIRPEDYAHYDAIAPGRVIGKVVGRERARRGAEVAAAYLAGRFEGNLLELLTNFEPDAAESAFHMDGARLEGFLARFTSGRCDMICNDCNWCPAFADFAITLKNPALREQKARHHLKIIEQFKQTGF